MIKPESNISFFREIKRCKIENISIEKLFNQGEKITTRKYSAVIGIEDVWSFFKKAVKSTAYLFPVPFW